MVGMSVVARGLGKKFGSVWGLREATFELERKSVSVLAGPNGAGKTTTTRILATYFKPDKGEAYVCGFDVVREYREVRRIIAYMPQEYRVSLDLTPEELVVSSLMKRGVSYSDAKREARRWLEALGMWELRGEEAVAPERRGDEEGSRSLCARGARGGLLPRRADNGNRRGGALRGPQGAEGGCGAGGDRVHDDTQPLRGAGGCRHRGFHQRWCDCCRGQPAEAAGVLPLEVQSVCEQPRGAARRRAAHAPGGQAGGLR
uniref:ATP-binding cassette domain-containing protein n=1 Tax=Thermofilum pendens TaxID=2269 RepID=A0A7C3SL43_THEPE